MWDAFSLNKTWDAFSLNKIWDAFSLNKMPSALNGMTYKTRKLHMLQRKRHQMKIVYYKHVVICCVEEETVCNLLYVPNRPIPMQCTAQASQNNSVNASVWSPYGLYRVSVWSLRSLYCHKTAVYCGFMSATVCLLCV